MLCFFIFFFFQAEDGIRDGHVTGVQTCALPIFGRAQLEQQVDLLMRELAQGLGLLRQADELDVALGEERMRERVGSVAEEANLEQPPLRAAEHEAHADDEHHRQQQREHERPPVAQELEIARVQHREEAAHHGRSSLPVSSRNRSSRLPGRIRRWPSGTRASSSVRSVASRSWVLISTRSLASMMLSGRSRAAGGNSWRGSSSSTSAKCSCSNRRGGPWAMM